MGVLFVPFIRINQAACHHAITREAPDHHADRRQSTLRRGFFKEGIDISPTDLRSERLAILGTFSLDEDRPCPKSPKIRDDRAGDRYRS